MTKKAFHIGIVLLMFTITLACQNFKFAVLSDLHINPHNPNPMNALEKSIVAINQIPDIDFVIVLGDVSEKGDKESLQLAKQTLGQLNAKHYAVSGNHETKWSPSGATAFADVFGSERFDFEQDGVRFLGFGSGPIIRMMDGHIDINDMLWLETELQKKPTQPTIIVTHYPLTPTDVDNWYDATDLLRRFNVKAILSGHYHTNKKTDYEGIPAIINRSSLFDKDGLTGFNIYTVNEEQIKVEEQKVDPYLKPWALANIPMQHNTYPVSSAAYNRPDYSLNNKFSDVGVVWSRNIYQSIYASPCVYNNKAFFGDNKGVFYAFNVNKEDMLWSFETGNRILGTADAQGNVVVFGSTDKNIYALNTNNGNVIWQYATPEAVIGSVTIANGTAYVGGSNGEFYALDVNTGRLKWQFSEVGNYIETKPLVTQGKVIFGAWDEYLYALDQQTGNLLWKWQGDKRGTLLSPAAVWPVATKDKVFIVAPDRYLTCIDINTGKTLWRINDNAVRESIGISEDGKRIYAKTMQDEVVCYSTESAYEEELLWKCFVGYGYEHGTSMLIEKSGVVYGSTKNGMIFAINGKTGDVLWKKKLGNSFIPTVAPVAGNKCFFVEANGLIGVIKGK